MNEQQYRVIADRDKGDDPQWRDVSMGDRVVVTWGRNQWEPARIERPVPTTDEPEDERVEAWHYVADHPVFKQCYSKEQPLLDSMLDRLNDLADMERTLVELAPHPPTREQVAEVLDAAFDDYRPYCSEAGHCIKSNAADDVLALIQNGADR
jgi:hypothetical protein